MPETIPLSEPIVATGSNELDHMPPGVGSDKVMDAPRQTDNGPAMDAGTGLTVIIRVLEQVVGNV